jgi:hypothetical protein
VVLFKNDWLVAGNAWGILSTKSAEQLLNSKRVVNSLENHGLKMEGIVSQSYNGASTMSGEVTGLQMRVRELVPPHDMFLVWCGGHRLNLVVEDVCKWLPFACSQHGSPDQGHATRNSWNWLKKNMSRAGSARVSTLSKAFSRPLVISFPFS